MMKIENPETFKKTIDMTYDKKMIKNIVQATENNSEKIDLIIDRLDTYNKIIDVFSLLKTKVNGMYLKDKEKKIIELLKEKELKIEEMMENTNFEKNTIKDIIAKNSEIIKLNIKTGGFYIE